MLAENPCIEDQTEISRHALWMLKKSSYAFRQATTSKEHWSQIEIHLRRNGAVPLILDPDVFTTSFERRNQKGDTNDPMYIVSQIAKDAYRRHCHRIYARRAFTVSSIVIVVCIAFTIQFLVPSERQHIDDITRSVGRVIGVKVTSENEKATLIKAELKNAKSAGKGFYQSLKSLLTNTEKTNKKDGEKK